MGTQTFLECLQKVIVMSLLHVYDVFYNGDITKG